MSAVETLREAAKALRERGAVPYGLPWTPDGTGGVNTAADLEDECAGPTIYVNGGLYANQNKTATYIATMHPGVALALADWLDAEVAVQDTMQPLAELVSVCVEQAGGPAGYVTIGHDDDGNPQMYADSSPAALRVAEAILGGAR